MRATFQYKAKRERERFFIFSFPNPKISKGFTLVELIIVIAIIVILVALAIPMSLRTRLQANEASTMGNLRTVSSAAESYRSAQNPPAYPSSFADMVNSDPSYLDRVWLSNQRQGYAYTFVSGNQGETYSASAAPRIPNVTGVNSFCVDHSGVIRSYPSGGGGSGDGCNANGTPI